MKVEIFGDMHGHFSDKVGAILLLHDYKSQILNLNVCSDGNRTCLAQSKASDLYSSIKVAAGSAGKNWLS